MELKKPVMIYDGECEFCRRWVVRWAKLTDDRVDYEAYQELLDELNKFPVTEKDCMTAVQLVDADGRVYSAAAAVLKSLTYTRHWGWLYWCYEHSGLFANFTEWLYRWVARNRW